MTLENQIDLLIINATLQSRIMISYTCDKILIDNKFVLVKKGNNWKLAVGNFGNSLRTIDRSTLTYAFVNTNTVLKYNA
jgi:hypothetical protein